MNRLAIAFFYDEIGIVDEYFIFLLKEMRKFVAKMVFVSNGPLTPQSEQDVRLLADDVLIRENIGFDVAAYTAGLDFIGFENLVAFDEVILFNHTFFGPLFPFEEMFSSMDGRSCDFWGISAHREMRPNPFNGESVLPFHLNSHFIAVRSSMASSQAFGEYWRTLPPVDSYTSSILLYETRFTQHFQSIGYRVDVYMDPQSFTTNYGLLEEVDRAVANRSPIMKRRSFFIDPVMADRLGMDVPQALSTLQNASGYDIGLIWKNVLRKHELRVLHTNAALMSILDDQEPRNREAWMIQRIAVCVHVYYIDLLEEILSYCENIPTKFDIIMTTDSIEKKYSIIRQINARPIENVNSVAVLVVEKNVGADTSALLITCRDLFLHENYDVVCRLHSKKSPQDGGAQARFFKRHLFENLVHSRGYVANVLNLFAEDARLGIAFPPAIHVYYGTLGHGWFGNKARTMDTAVKLGIDVQFDEATPLAPYGGMFWFRPAALRKLFAYQWEWKDFEEDIAYADGDLPHAIERLYAYVAQDAGFTPRAIASRRQAEQNYVRLEFKLQRLVSLIPQGDFADNCIALEKWKRAGFPMAADSYRINVSSVSHPGTNPLTITAAARIRVAAEYLRSDNRYWAKVLKYVVSGWQSRVRMLCYIDGVNGLPNPGAAVLRFSREATNNLRVEGWALQPGARASFEAVVLRLDGGGGRIVEVSSLCERPDVAEHFGRADLQRCGFEGCIPISNIPRGAYTLRLVGITKHGKRYVSDARTTIVIS